MAHRKRHLILTAIAAVVFAFLPTVRAQTPAADAATEFRVVSMADVTTVFYDSPDGREIVNAGVGSFSRVYKAPKNRQISLYTEIPSLKPDTPPTKVVLARAQLPASGTGPYLLLLRPNPDGSEVKFSAQVVDHSLKAHPAQTYLVFNFSKRRLAVNLADKNMVLDPGQSESVPYPNTRKSWLKVAVDEQSDGWLLVSSSAHAIGADTRTCVFLVDIAPSEWDPNPKGIVARRIRESVTIDEVGIVHIR